MYRENKPEDAQVDFSSPLLNDGSTHKPLVKLHYDCAVDSMKNQSIVCSKSDAQLTSKIISF